MFMHRNVAYLCDITNGAVNHSVARAGNRAQEMAGTGGAFYDRRRINAAERKKRQIGGFGRG